MATLSSVLAWRIPWIEDPGVPSSIGSQSQTRLKRLSTHAWTHIYVYMQTWPPPYTSGATNTQTTEALKPSGTRYNAEDVSLWALDIQFANSSGSASIFLLASVPSSLYLPGVVAMPSLAALWFQELLGNSTGVKSIQFSLAPGVRTLNATCLKASLLPACSLPWNHVPNHWWPWCFFHLFIHYLSRYFLGFCWVFCAMICIR